MNQPDYILSNQAVTTQYFTHCYLSLWTDPYIKLIIINRTWLLVIHCNISSILTISSYDQIKMTKAIEIDYSLQLGMIEL